MTKNINVVWASNLDDEFRRIVTLSHTYRYIAVDFEYPGVIVHTARDASTTTRYADMKSNVDCMNPIQVGLTLFNNNDDHHLPSHMTWQINLNGFNPETDLQSRPSIELLRRSGVDLERNRAEGVSESMFADRMVELLFEGLQWVTFHGLYDLGYLMKIMTLGDPLPDTASEFMCRVSSQFGTVYDVKYIAGACDGLKGGEIGLMTASKILKVDVEDGVHHQAGYDSLVTAMVFSKMKMTYMIDEFPFRGKLYGIHKRHEPRRAWHTQSQRSRIVMRSPTPVMWSPSSPPPMMMVMHDGRYNLAPYFCY
ncbi:hypothetical protein QJS10_CPA08g00165 [Acorus calamus]|uniref:poly(A)-specific ribonuclease n=1 Tax=Acorus calamus TaxID=4465 RepID=A0AAV9E8Z0_ACOCL|nr:hypothetical protein QJS10_CPA08g00165 [Acorus calamus]